MVVVVVVVIVRGGVYVCLRSSCSILGIYVCTRALSIFHDEPIGAARLTALLCSLARARGLGSRIYLHLAKSIWFLTPSDSRYLRYVVYKLKCSFPDFYSVLGSTASVRLRYGFPLPHPFLLGTCLGTPPSFWTPFCFAGV